MSLLKTILPNRSFARRMQDEWCRRVAGFLPKEGKILDLGGIKNSDYHRVMGIPEGRLILWNFDDSLELHARVDLDKAKELPAYPKEAQAVLLMNVLEHLYRPFELLEWVSREMPRGATLFALVPYASPIHPSPHDYWRISPEAFARFFAECGQKGELEIIGLGEDWRNYIGPLTANWFKSSKRARFLGALFEHLFCFLSVFVPKASLKAQAERFPAVIGLRWVKH